MKLREWQRECCQIALHNYKNSQFHFLCLASPGAGKTVMAAQTAKKLFEAELIDFVLCFSPSITIAKSIQETFSNLLGCNFEGQIGDNGGSYTYQSMSHKTGRFWRLLKNNRVLVVLDEIHHCAGISVEDSNSWGALILSEIQYNAQYTLALTGTPWRSDKIPIVLSKYADEHGAISCDYIYGLSDAIKDQVCRVPKIIVIDSDRLTLKTDNQTQIFGSFQELIRSKLLSYQDIVTQKEAMNYVLKRGVEQLRIVRKYEPSAAGLVVASSVEHAIELKRILVECFLQSAVVVSYRDHNAQEIINNFRRSDSQWVVSVGMISEGTDIPRLQVCCHLSTTKTELYFRQVLGRVIRQTGNQRQDAWLFTIAERSLIQYAERIIENIPEEHNVNIEVELMSKTEIDLVKPFVENEEQVHITDTDLLELNKSNHLGKLFENQSDTTLTLDRFRARIISHF